MPDSGGESVVGRVRLSEAIGVVPPDACVQIEIRTRPLPGHAGRAVSALACVGRGAYMDVHLSMLAEGK